MHHAFDAGFLLKIWFVTSAKFQCESFELNSPSFSLHFPASISPFFSSAPVYFPRGRLTTGSKNGSMDGSNKMEDSRVCPCGGLVCRAGVWGRGPRPVRGVRRPRGGRRRPRRRCGGVLPLGRIQHILAGSSPGQPSPSKREGGVTLVGVGRKPFSNPVIPSLHPFHLLAFSSGGSSTSPTSPASTHFFLLPEAAPPRSG